MANIQPQAKKPFSVAIRSDMYQNLINNTLGDKEVARRFVAEISSVVANNEMLRNCDAGSIVSAALLAQTVNLSLAPSLGLAYLVPYGGKAQFQIGYKGLVQLAIRSGQFKTLGVRPVHDGEYAGQDEFGEDTFKFSHDFDDKPVVGYYAYFVLTNGFKKTLYMTVQQVNKHAKLYSKNYAKYGTGLWKDQFDLMAEKTVLKLLLNRFAPLSIEMQKVIQADQAIIKEDGEYVYADNPEEEQPKPSKTALNVESILPTADDNGVVQAPATEEEGPDQPW